MHTTITMRFPVKISNRFKIASQTSLSALLIRILRVPRGPNIYLFSTVILQKKTRMKLCSCNSVRSCVRSRGEFVSCLRNVTEPRNRNGKQWHDSSPDTSRLACPHSLETKKRRSNFASIKCPGDVAALDNETNFRSLGSAWYVNRKSNRATAAKGTKILCYLLLLPFNVDYANGYRTFTVKLEHNNINEEQKIETWR